jgi:hypothetical protein
MQKAPAGRLLHLSYAVWQRAQNLPLMLMP